jgi:hypothetical protein
MKARMYYAQIDITYSGGRLPGEERDALLKALRKESRDFSLTVKEELHTVVVVSMTLRKDNPLDAISTVSRHLDQALLATGLFEKFDVTGRELHVRPMHGWRSN